MHGNGGDLGEDFGSSVVCVEALHTQGILWWAASLPYHRRSKKAGLGLFHYFWTWLECHMNTTCIYGTAAPPTSHPSLTACHACATACRPAGWLTTKKHHFSWYCKRSVGPSSLNQSPPSTLHFQKRLLPGKNVKSTVQTLWDIRSVHVNKTPWNLKTFFGFFFLLQI